MQLEILRVLLRLFPSLLATRVLYFVCHGQAMDPNWFLFLMTAGETLHVALHLIDKFCDSLVSTMGNLLD